MVVPLVAASVAETVDLLAASMADELVERKVVL